jgi:hypothetical protein
MSHNYIGLHCLLQEVAYRYFYFVAGSPIQSMVNNSEHNQIVWQIKMACKMEAHRFRKSEDRIYYGNFVIPHNREDMPVRY